MRVIVMPYFVRRRRSENFLPLIMLSCWCVLRVIALTVLLSMWHTILFVYWIYPITWAVSCVFFLGYYLFSDWAKERKG